MKHKKLIKGLMSTGMAVSFLSILGISEQPLLQVIWFIVNTIIFCLFAWGYSTLFPEDLKNIPINKDYKEE